MSVREVEIELYVSALILVLFLCSHVLKATMGQQQDGVQLLVDLPVIDLQSEVLWQEIRGAHEQFGFFQIVNHGVPGELMVAVLQACKDFFSSSEDVKDGLAAEKGYRREGYNKNPSASTFGMQIRREHLYLYLKPVPRRNYGKWPASHRGLVEELGECCTAVYRKLMTAMSKNLGLEPLQILHSLGDEVKQTFCAFRYPSGREATGVPEHTDLGSVVLLFGDDVPGLQILNDNKWLTVRPVPGSFIVGLGEISEIVSNGIFRAAEHRVQLNAEQARFSCAVTFEPADKSMIAPAVDRLQARYRSFVYEDRYAEYEQGKQAKHFAMLSL